MDTYEKLQHMIEEATGEPGNMVTDSIKNIFGNSGITISCEDDKFHLCHEGSEKEMYLDELIAYAGNLLYQESIKKRNEVSEIFDLQDLEGGLKSYVSSVTKLHQIESVYAQVCFERSLDYKR